MFPWTPAELWPLTLSGSSDFAGVIERTHLASFWSSYDSISLFLFSYLSSMSPLGWLEEKRGKKQKKAVDWGPCCSQQKCQGDIKQWKAGWAFLAQPVCFPSDSFSSPACHHQSFTEPFFLWSPCPAHFPACHDFLEGVVWTITNILFYFISRLIIILFYFVYWFCK